jgi:hypothetical protein
VNGDRACRDGRLTGHAGAFVRALLPVKLTEGHTVTFGVWPAIHLKDLKPAFDSWRDPACEHRHLVHPERAARPFQRDIGVGQL